MINLRGRLNLQVHLQSRTIKAKKHTTSMKGLVVSAIVALCLGSIPGPASSQMGVPSVTGTCNSIGYSDRCCPTVPPTDCHATDGNCDCSTNCHRFGDCCMDNSCDRCEFNLLLPMYQAALTANYSDPTTCQAAGITQCCTESVSGNSMCDVFHNRTFHCSCQESCHRMNNCCPDIDTIGCPRRKL